MGDFEDGTFGGKEKEEGEKEEEREKMMIVERQKTVGNDGV